MGVDIRVWNRLSIEIPEALVMVREIFIVLIWHSMKLLDFG